MRSALFWGMVLRCDGYVEGGDAAPGYGFAVEELFVVGGGFDGVADGVAEVEDHAQAGLFFVFADDVGFDADGGGYDAGEGGGVSCEDGVGVLFHVAEEFCVVDDAGFDGLLQAGAEFRGWKGARGGRCRRRRPAGGGSCR